MSNPILLFNVAEYSDDRINGSKVSRECFVTTDSMIQNKGGITNTPVLPKGNLIAYSKGDILVGNIRPYLKKIWYADRNGGCSPDVLVFRSKSNIDSKFLYYTLFRDDFFNHMMKGSKGTKMPRGDKNQILRFHIPEIELPIQKKIASVLSALDTKIELNSRINAELEAMAKTLYDYWFVQFDFPDKNGKPYKTSGGKMVWNEELKREVPEGFLDCKLGDVLASTGTGLNPRDNFVLGEGDNFYVTIKNIEQGRVILDNRCDKISDDSLEIINKRSDLKVGDILFTSIEPVGITYLILEKPKNWNINESVFTIRPNYEKVTSEFLYMFLSSDYIKSYTKNVSAGSIHKGVRHGLLKDCKFILPKRNAIDAFTMKIEPILKKLDLIQKENQKLTELRDWLLPMLMNGQVRVSEL